VTNDFMETTRK